MEKFADFAHSIIKQTVQKMIQREASEWPPICGGIHYQLRRPERPLVKAAEEKKP